MEKRKRVVACIILLCIMFVGGIFVYNHLQDNSTIDIQTTIDYKVFKNPLQSSKTRPLWFWNDDVSEMSEDKVREIVEKSYKQSGYDGMAILPNWIDGYLTDEYFELYEAALDEGQKHGMHFTLYDENGFPSSNAGGILAQKYPDLTSKRLDKYEQDTSESEPVTIDLPIGTCMGAVAMNLETFERLNITDTVIENSDGSYRLKYTPESGNWKIMAFMCVLDGNNSMDYLDEKSVSAFIDITYEAYYDRFKKYFDNGTITGAFYDEPTFWPWGDETSSYGVEGGRVWTSDYNTEYEKRYGNNPTLDYPALWYSIGEDTQEARDKLFGVRTNLFADNYIGQMNQWCDEHRIELTGHMLLEEWRNPVGLDGDLMKVFKNQDIPGVDVIGGFGNAQEAYKIISSSAYNWDKDKIMAESFGGMGTNVPISTLYKTTMDLYAKGIN